MASLTVPQSLFTTLQAAFLAEGKRLCADASKILRVPEKELVKKLFQEKKLHLTLVEDSERPLSCLVSVKEKAILRRCRQPCLLGTSRCILHQSVEYIPENSESIPSLTRIAPHPSLPNPLWCNEETGAVLNAQGQEVGLYKDGCLSLWSFESEEDKEM